MASGTMKAVNYVGPFQVKVEEVDKPSLVHPDDVIVKVTTVSLFLVAEVPSSAADHVVGGHLRLRFAVGGRQRGLISVLTSTQHV